MGVPPGLLTPAACGTSTSRRLPAGGEGAGGTLWHGLPPMADTCSLVNQSNACAPPASKAGAALGTLGKGASLMLPTSSMWLCRVPRGVGGMAARDGLSMMISPSNTATTSRPQRISRDTSPTHEKAENVQGSAARSVVFKSGGGLRYFPFTTRRVNRKPATGLIHVPPCDGAWSWDGGAAGAANGGRCLGAALAEPSHAPLQPACHTTR